MRSTVGPWSSVGGVAAGVTGSAIAAAVAAVLIGALFAAADTALTSLSATRLEALVDQARGPTKAALVRIQRADTLLRSRYLLGRIASSAVATLCGYEALAPVAGSRAPWVSLLVTILVMGVTFEITTTLARKHADQAAPAFVRWLWPLEMLMLPIAETNS